MRSMSHEGHTLRFVDRGAGEPIVFVHNGALSHRLWDRQLERFERTHRVVAPDLLGHGASDRPDVVYTADGFVRQLGHLVDHLGLETFHLVGCCLGGSVAIEYALRHRSRVRTLTAITAVTPATVGPGLFGPLDSISRPRQRRREVAWRACETRPGRWAMSRAFERLQCGPRALADASFRDHVRGLYRSDGEWRVFCTTDYSTFGRLDRLTGDEELPPTLVMWGERNRILPAAAGRELVARLRPERAEFWPDCGYMLMRERPEDANRVLAEHFASGQPAVAPLKSSASAASIPA